MTDTADACAPIIFRNLGNAIDRHGDPDAPAVIKLGSEPASRSCS